MLRCHEAMDRDPQKHDRMDQSNQRAFSIRKNPKFVHNHLNSVSSIRHIDGVTHYTNFCDLNHRMADPNLESVPRRVIPSRASC